MRRALDRLLNILFVYPTDTWEFGGTLIAYAFVAPFTIYEGPTLLAPEAYAVLTADFPESVYGFVILFAAVLSTLAIFLSKFSALRIVAAVLQFVIWTTLGFAMHTAGAIGIAPAFFAFSAMWLLTAFRLYGARRNFPELAKSHGLSATLFAGLNPKR